MHPSGRSVKLDVTDIAASQLEVRVEAGASPLQRLQVRTTMETTSLLEVANAQDHEVR
jgi:hypothetical protein